MIAIATSGRADWGLLSPLAKRLQREKEVEIVATNMHLIPQNGTCTVNEIYRDGFTPVHIPVGGNNVEIAAASLRSFGDYFRRQNPEAVVILGDRYEMMAVAMAAVLTGVPIIHIAGGAISEGAFDDSFRHGITKLSTLHLAETEEYRQRIIQMGEMPERVVNTGAIGVEYMMNATLLSQKELKESLGFPIDKKTLIATMHPSTLDPVSPEEQMKCLLTALERFGGYNVVFTYPNNDTDPAPLIRLINDFQKRNSDRVNVIPSMGHLRYISALQYAGGVVGNSSSGIVEVPSAGIPTLDIGIRQKGRSAAPSVVHCEGNMESILQGLYLITSPAMQEKASSKVNPYYKEGTLELMASAILNYDFHPFPVKAFHNVNH